MFKKYHHYILNHWQIPDENVHSFAGSVCFIICSCFVFGFSFIKSPIPMLNNISNVTFKYMAFLFLCLSVILLYYGLFTTKSNFKFLNKPRLSNVIKNIFTWLFHVLAAFTIIIALPFMLSLSIIGFIISKRAKKIDNLISLNMLWVIIGMIIMILLYPFALLSYFVSGFVYSMLLTFDFSCDLVAIFLFLFISLLKFLIDSTLCIMLKILNWYRRKKQFNLNLKTSELHEELDYDLAYFKNTTRRLQILILVISLTLTLLGIIPDILIEYQSQLLNVLTVYTVIMLYIDKRKEIK
ncbi:MAG: hypothetical protein E6370_13980 [Clostridiales bacterium]|jgi:hypothetical protein|nr:hypothetical protein [Clostridiales bacterium]